MFYSWRGNFPQGYMLEYLFFFNFNKKIIFEAFFPHSFNFFLQYTIRNLQDVWYT